MQLDAPLLTLIERCETICVAGCCGREAFDFSPIHIASHLIRYSGQIEDKEVAALRNQLETLSINYGQNGASGKGAAIDVLNEHLSPLAVDRLVDELQANLTRAIDLITEEKTAQNVSRADLSVFP